MADLLPDHASTVQNSGRTVESRVVHQGRAFARTEGDWHHAKLEAVFAKAWKITNHPPSFLNGGYGTLQWLLCSDGASSPTRAVTQEEATVAATVIQWLGTPCGFDWLMQTVKSGGYHVVRDSVEQVASKENTTELIAALDRSIADFERNQANVLRELRKARKRLAGRLR